MKKIYGENGQINENGKAETEVFVNQTKRLLDNSSSETERRLIGSILQKIVGDLTST